MAAEMVFADPSHPITIKRFPRAPWASRRVEASYCSDMSHVLTESDLEKLDISSMLCYSLIKRTKLGEGPLQSPVARRHPYTDLNRDTDDEWAS
jgi:hypothetical protein